jgi:DNA repair protein RadC
MIPSENGHTLALRISEIPTATRPRERLLQSGANALSEIELIAILLRTGIAGASALAVAQTLLSRYQSLQALARATPQEIAQVKGIGLAKAVQISAAFGLGQRAARESLSYRKIDTPREVCSFLGPEMRALHRESLRVILLDARFHLLRCEEISLGSIAESIAHPREIFRPALIHSAYGVIVVHNHPSGDPSPSEADCRLTERLREAAALLQIILLDHIIIGSQRVGIQKEYYSFKEAKLL